MCDTVQDQPTPFGPPPAADQSPPGWPAALRRAGSTGWEEEAVPFLLDLCPAEFRRYPVLRRQPLALAHFARRFVAAEAEAVVAGTSEVRTHLGHCVPPDAVAAALDAWLIEGARLARAHRVVKLIEEALRRGGGTTGQAAEGPCDAGRPRRG